MTHKERYLGLSKSTSLCPNSSHPFPFIFFLPTHSPSLRFLRFSSFLPFLLGAVRFIRAVIGTKEVEYLEYIIKHDLFQGIVEVFLKNGSKYNLLNSAIIELFDFIRTSNLKSMVHYLGSQYTQSLQNINYVETFQRLIAKYEQNLAEPPTSTETTYVFSLFSSSTFLYLGYLCFFLLPSSHRERKPKIRLADTDSDEDYFSRDDDDDDDGTKEGEGEGLLDSVNNENSKGTNGKTTTTEPEAKTNPEEEEKRQQKKREHKRTREEEEEEEEKSSSPSSTSSKSSSGKNSRRRKSEEISDEEVEVEEVEEIEEEEEDEEEQQLKNGGATGVENGNGGQPQPSPKKGKETEKEKEPGERSPKRKKL
jgi:hypothetical protein